MIHMAETETETHPSRVEVGLCMHYEYSIYGVGVWLQYVYEYEYEPAYSPYTISHAMLCYAMQFCDEADSSFSYSYLYGVSSKE
jgi:hypothetical protein